MRAKILIVSLLAWVPAAHAHQPHGRRIVGFATSPCVSSQCFGKHPSGTWRHPITAPGGGRRSATGYNYPGRAAAASTF